MGKRAKNKGQEQDESERAKRGSFPVTDGGHGASAVYAWERQPDESPQAYARFVLYRQSPPSERSIRKLGISMQLAARWSRKHSWVRRTAMWDSWLVELSDGLASHAALGARRAAVRFGSVSVAKATKAVEAMDETKLSADEAIALAKTGDALSRQALELSPRPTVAAPAVSVSTAVVWADGKPAWANQTGPSQDEASRTEANGTEPKRIEPAATDLVLVRGSEKVLGEGVGGQPRTVSGKLVDKVVNGPERGSPNNQPEVNT